MANEKLIIGITLMIAAMAYMKRKNAVVAYNDMSESKDTINSRRAAALGKAHETGNYAEFMNKYNRHYQVNVAHGI